MKEDIYIVEKLTDIKIQEGKIQVRIKWEGYKESENTWEPIQNLSKGCG